MGQFEQKNAYVNIGSKIQSKFDESKTVQFLTLPAKTLQLFVDQLNEVIGSGADYAAVEMTYSEKTSSNGNTFIGGTIKAKPGSYEKKDSTTSKVSALKEKRAK